MYRENVLFFVDEYFSIGCNDNALLIELDTSTGSFAVASSLIATVSSCIRYKIETNYRVLLWHLKNMMLMYLPSVSSKQKRYIDLLLYHRNVLSL